MKLPENNSPKKVGLAISGGFIRPVAAIGIIEELEKNGVEISMVSGCSAGGAIAAAYAAQTMGQLKERLANGSRRDYWEVMFDPTLPRNGFLKGQRAKEFIKEWIGEREFKDLHKKLFLTATDLSTMSPVIMESGSVAEAVRAAVSVPGMFVPVKYGNKFLADGGNFNLIPSKVLYENGADYVIAIHTAIPPNPITRALSKTRQLLGMHKKTVYKPKLYVKDPHLFSVLWRAANISSREIKNFYQEAYEYDLLIKPDIVGVKRWSVSKVHYLIEQGREAAQKALPQVKKDLNL